MLPCFTRQDASAFNQPLSWNTSSVTTISRMFYVRSAPALPAASAVSGRPCALLAPPPLSYGLPPPGPHCTAILMLPSRLNWQGASAFNQPLSLDTSSVTDMEYMFRVRSAHALCHQPPQLLGPPCTLRAPPATRTARRPSSDASLSTRQDSSAFNQPLSLDTSSLTDMRYMFYVRSAPALPAASTVGSSLHAACATAASPRPPATWTAFYPSSLNASL
jgi:hypothetical protein